MYAHKHFALSLTLAGLVALTTVGASAETITKGSFDLPAQAYWNDILLQPGAYHLSVDRNNSGHNAVLLRGQGMSAIFMIPAGSETSSGRSFLRLDDLNGTLVIREFDAGAVGRAYRFGVSKKAREMTLRGGVAQPVTERYVAVAAR